MKPAANNLNSFGTTANGCESLRSTWAGIGKKEKVRALLSKIEEAEAAGTMSTMRTKNNSEIQLPTTAVEVECDDKVDKEAFGTLPDNARQCDERVKK